MSGSSSEVVFEDDRFRVTRWTIEPGGEIGMHRHEHDYVVVPMSESVMHVTTSAGERIVAELRPGAAYARAIGAEHRNENRGEAVVDFIEVEWLGPRPEDGSASGPHDDPDAARRG